VITPIENEDERIENYFANEKVCFAAFAALYSELVPEELYRDIVKYPTEHLLRYWDKDSAQYDQSKLDGPYNFEYFLWFVPCVKDAEVRQRLTAVLRQNPAQFWEVDFSKSDSDYVHLPCDYGVCSPDCIVYPAVRELVDDALSYRIKQQCPDGKWPLGWSFGKSEGLRRLQTLYEAHRTNEMLVKLKRFGRIEL
jgi:hypothetical protein